MTVGADQIGCVGCKYVFENEFLGQLITVSHEVKIPAQPRRGLRRAQPSRVVKQETVHRLGGYYPGTLAKITTLCGTEGIDIQRMSFFRPDENPIQLQDELVPATKDKPYKGRPRCRECRVDDIEVDRLIQTGLALQKRRRKQMR